MKLATALILVSATTLATTACSKKKRQDGGGSEKIQEGGGKPAIPGGGGVVTVDGSSTVFLISKAVAEDFDDAGLGDATVAKSGTGGGFQKFCRGEVDVTGASRPIKPTEVDGCKAGGIEYIELPIAYDGLAVVVHPSNDWVDHLTTAELKKMWEPAASEKINNWSQVREGWPDKKLGLYGPGTDSGTYDYFTQAINGKEHSSRGDFTSNEDDNVLVQGVAGDPGAVGYFGYAYYIENKDKLELVAVDDGDDKNGKGPILPDLTTVANGTYQPLSRPVFIYVSTKALGRGSVQRFVTYFLDNARRLAEEVGYIPLPAQADALVRKRYDDRTTGSVFAGMGSQVGVTIEKLLSSEGG